MHINLLLLCITTIKEKEEEEGGMDMIKMCSIYHQYECILSSLNLLLKKKRKVLFRCLGSIYTQPSPSNKHIHPPERKLSICRKKLFIL